MKKQKFYYDERGNKYTKTPHGRMYYGGYIPSPNEVRISARDIIERNEVVFI